MTTHTPRLYQNHWTNNYHRYRFWQPIVKAFGLIFGTIIVIILLTGAIFFWMPHVPIISSANNTDQLQVAESGLTMAKKMTGNSDAWAAAIEKEYAAISHKQITIASACMTPSDNFVEAQTLPYIAENFRKK